MTGDPPPKAADRPLAPGGDPYGTHRSIEPKLGLPQAAWRLDADFGRLFEGEALIQVETLNIDAASFVQMEEGAEGGPISKARWRGSSCRPWRSGASSTTR